MQIFGFLGSLLGYVLWGAFYLLYNYCKTLYVSFYNQTAKINGRYRKTFQKTKGNSGKI